MNTLATMAQYGHERVCLHTDEETGLRAIIAIHSTTLGDALGGTRRWHYATEADALEDVLRLSEGMTLKAACAGLAMGGAKSVILLPSPGAPATKEEARAMGRFIDTFSGNYIAAEDVGVDEQFGPDGEFLRKWGGPFSRRSLPIAHAYRRGLLRSDLRRL